MRLRQVALGVEDLSRAIGFYTELLSTQPTAIFPGLAFFDLDGVRLLLDANLSPTNRSGLLYLEIPSTRLRIEELRLRGVQIEIEPHVVFPDPDGIFDRPGDEWLAFIKDSEGNLLGLMSREKSNLKN